jgi:hypothetical protein
MTNQEEKIKLLTGTLYNVEKLIPENYHGVPCPITWVAAWDAIKILCDYTHRAMSELDNDNPDNPVTETE